MTLQSLFPFHCVVVSFHVILLQVVYTWTLPSSSLTSEKKKSILHLAVSRWLIHSWAFDTWITSSKSLLFMLILLLNSCFCSIWTCISNLFLCHAALFLPHNSLRESLFPQACPYPWIRYLLIQSLCWIHLHKTSSSPSSIVIILAHTWSLQSLLPQSTIIINLLY